MKELIVIDDFLSKEDHHKFYELTLKREWNPVHDERDSPFTSQSGYCSMTSFEDEEVQLLLSQCAMHSQLETVIASYYSQSLYNKYDPKKPTYFHVDPGAGWTIVYFPHTQEYDIQMGGETQILVNNQIVGVLPIPNRLIAFDGGLQHKGTSFGYYQARYSFAIQFSDNPPK